MKKFVLLLFLFYSGVLDVPLDTWTELAFNFTKNPVVKPTPASRISNYFDKIVVQFVDEGHTADGTFYFDDFEFLAK